MTIRSAKPVPDGSVASSDEDIDHHLVEAHDAVEAKLAKARASIARGEAEPLEPLDALLRHARHSGR